MYAKQVRAFTKAGESRWSEVVEGFTDQSGEQTREVVNVYCR